MDCSLKKGAVASLTFFLGFPWVPRLLQFKNLRQAGDTGFLANEVPYQHPRLTGMGITVAVVP